MRPNGVDLKYVETMNSVGLNNLSLKYQRFMTLGCKDLGIRKSEFVAKSQFLLLTTGLKKLRITCDNLSHVFLNFNSANNWIAKNFLKNLNLWMKTYKV